MHEEVLVAAAIYLHNLGNIGLDIRWGLRGAAAAVAFTQAGVAEGGEVTCARQ